MSPAAFSTDGVSGSVSFDGETSAMAGDAVDGAGFVHTPYATSARPAATRPPASAIVHERPKAARAVPRSTSLAIAASDFV